MFGACLGRTSRQTSTGLIPLRSFGPHLVDTSTSLSPKAFLSLPQIDCFLHYQMPSGGLQSALTHTPIGIHTQHLSTFTPLWLSGSPSISPLGILPTSVDSVVPAEPNDPSKGGGRQMERRPVCTAVRIPPPLPAPIYTT